MTKETFNKAVELDCQINELQIFVNSVAEDYSGNCHGSGKSKIINNFVFKILREERCNVYKKGALKLEQLRKQFEKL